MNGDFAIGFPVYVAAKRRIQDSSTGGDLYSEFCLMTMGRSPGEVPSPHTAMCCLPLFTSEMGIRSFVRSNTDYDARYGLVLTTGSALRSLIVHLKEFVGLQLVAIDPPAQRASTPIVGFDVAEVLAFLDGLEHSPAQGTAARAAVITASKRQSAFAIWMKAFERYRINVAVAGNPFGRRWIQSPSDLSDDLTVAADVLWAISNGLTRKSVPIFAEKVRALVCCRDENEYLMYLSELEVPALLASRVSPIAFEPAVPRDADSAAKPPSSDYSVSLPSGEVFIEATTMDLRWRPTGTAAVMKRLDRKLDEKRRQACRDRVYLLALKVLGPPETFVLMRQLVNERVWPNRKFRRYGGMLAFADTLAGPGRFQGMWLPNPLSVAAPADDVTDLFHGRRCYHLHNVKDLRCSRDEVARLRRQVSAGRRTTRGVAVPVRLRGGPLDGIEILLRPTQVGDAEVTFVWDFEGRAQLRGIHVTMPPHGPIKIAYRRCEDTRYVFTGYRFWFDEYRPTGRAADYLLQLSFLD